MKLVTGGSFQGKYTFTQETLGIRDGWIDGENCEYNDIFKCKAIQHFNEFIKRAMDNQWPIDSLPDDLMKRNPNIVIVTNEQGSGIVPAKAFDRHYREVLGRVCEDLAGRSDEVYRVICGIGMELKHA